MGLIAPSCEIPVTTPFALMSLAPLLYHSPKQFGALESGVGVCAPPLATALFRGCVPTATDPLEGPPDVRISLGLCRVCCAASRTGTASAANKVMAAMHFNVLDFILPPLMCRLGAEGPVQSNHCEAAKSGCGALSRRSLFSKRLVSSQIIAGRALNAPSDGAFAC